MGQESLIIKPSPQFLLYLIKLRRIAPPKKQSKPYSFPFRICASVFISVSDNYIGLLMGTSLAACLTANSKQPRL